MIKSMVYFLLYVSFKGLHSSRPYEGPTSGPILSFELKRTKIPEFNFDLIQTVISSLNLLTSEFIKTFH